MSLNVGQLDRCRVLRFYRTYAKDSKNPFDGPAPVNDTWKPISQAGDEWDSLVENFSLTPYSEGRTWIAFSMAFGDFSRFFLTKWPCARSVAWQKASDKFFLVVY